MTYFCRLEHSKGKAVIPEIQEAARGWIKLLDGSLKIANGGRQFATDTRHWVQCLSMPNRFNAEQLKDYINSVVENAQATMNTVEDFHKKLCAQKGNTRELEMKLGNIRSELQEEKEGHNKVISEEKWYRNILAAASASTGAGTGVTALRGITSPTSFWVTLSITAATVVGAVVKSQIVINAEKKSINICDHTSTELSSTEDRLNELILQIEGLQEWWQKIIDCLTDIQRHTWSLSPNNLEVKACRVLQIDEALALLLKQFENYSEGIRRLQSRYPPSLTQGNPS